MKKLIPFIVSFIMMGNTINAQERPKNTFSIMPVNSFSVLDWSLGVSYERYLDKQNKWSINLPVYTYLKRNGNGVDMHVVYNAVFQVNPGIYYRPFRFEKPNIHYGIGLTFLYHQDDYTIHDPLALPKPWKAQEIVKAVMLANRLDFDINKRFDLGIQFAVGSGNKTNKHHIETGTNVRHERLFMGQYQFRMGFRF